MLDVLLRYIDPIQSMRRQAELRRKREAVPPEIDEDEVEIPTVRSEPPMPVRECRVCQHRSGDRFCPTCLAETMELVRK